MPTIKNVPDDDVSLHQGVEQLRTADGWLSLYHWRTGVWYLSMAGQVVCTLSGADVGIYREDDLTRHFPRARRKWTLQWTDTPGLPLRVYRTSTGMTAAVVPGENGRVRAETFCTTEEHAVSCTINKANKLRRVCREAASRVEEGTFHA